MVGWNSFVAQLSEWNSILSYLTWVYIRYVHPENLFCFLLNVVLYLFVLWVSRLSIAKNRYTYIYSTPKLPQFCLNFSYFVFQKLGYSVVRKIRVILAHINAQPYQFFKKVSMRESCVKALGKNAILFSILHYIVANSLYIETLNIGFTRTCTMSNLTQKDF